MIRKAMLFILLVSIIACQDDTTSPEGMAQVKVVSSMSNKSVHSSNISGFLEHGVDSLVVTKFRILISSIKLHGYNDNDEKYESFKTGPYVLKADSTNSFYYLSEHTVPEGNYDKIKFEMHKFPESERVLYVGDTLYGEFATNDKYTFLIDGFYYEDGEKIPFEFKSNSTENLTLKFDPMLELTDDGVNNIDLDIMPELLFVANGTIIKPTEENWKDIEKNIHKSIKALKKHFN